MAFELLQKPAGTLELLVYLHRHGKSPPITVTSDTGMSRDAFYNAKERLKSLGFLYEDRDTGYPRYVYVGLTRAGDEVARALGPVGDLLSATATALEAELEGLERADEAASLPRRIEILALLADRDYSLGRWDAAEASSRRLVEAARRAKDDRSEAVGRLTLCRVLQKRDRHDEAADELGEARRAADGAHAPGLASEVEYLLGSNLERQGRWAEALERFAASAGRAREAEDAVLAARARQATARILARRGRLDESLAILREVASELQSLGASGEDDLPRAYVALGSTTYSMGRPEAADWYEKAIEAARRVGDLRMEAYGLSYTVPKWAAARQFPRAEAALGRAREIFDGIGELTGMGTVELHAAQLLAAQDRWSEADDRFDAALRIARESANRFQEAWVQFAQGQMRKRQGRSNEARSLFLAAKRTFQDLGSEARVARCDEELRGLTEP